MKTFILRYLKLISIENLNLDTLKFKYIISSDSNREHPYFNDEINRYEHLKTILSYVFENKFKESIVIQGEFFKTLIYHIISTEEFKQFCKIRLDESCNAHMQIFLYKNYGNGNIKTIKIPSFDSYWLYIGGFASFIKNDENLWKSENYEHILYRQFLQKLVWGNPDLDLNDKCEEEQEMHFNELINHKFKINGSISNWDEVEIIITNKI